MFVLSRRPLLVGLLGAPLAVACGQSSSPPARELPTDSEAPDPGDGGVPAEAAAWASTPPLDLTGASAGAWAWFEFPDTVCRDGSPAGFAMNLSPSGVKKVMFFFEGGGACFNELTCEMNGSKVFHKQASGSVFDRANSANPFAEYTQVLVPYCTGDVHAGNHPNAEVAGVKQQFVGYTNAEYFLKKIAATFPDLERLVITGPSAGGYGAAANFGQALRLFPSTPVNLVDDSGPMMGNPPLAPCLQEQWKTLWGLDKTIIAECGADCVGQADYLRAAFKHWVATSKHAVGLISATGDETIRSFFGFGDNDCGPPTLSSTPVDAFAAGLEDIKADLAPYKNFGAFFFDATTHTVMENDRFYTVSSDGKTPAEWVRSIVESDSVSNVGP